MTYYNEFDPFMADWLERLIGAGLISPGRVDRRSITEVTADDVRGYTRVHLFAGLGGWDYAADLAGWSGSIFTGSCPCQPFSSDGEHLGFDDGRHLWPQMWRLIRAVRPASVFGEQVVSTKWWDLVAANLQSDGYTVRAEVRTSVVQRRRRLFWSARLAGQGVEGLDPSPHPRIAGPWGWRGQADMQQLAVAPFERGDRWPEPLLRRVADGLPGRVVRGAVKGFGNAIVPHVAAEYIRGENRPI